MSTFITAEQCTMDISGSALHTVRMESNAKVNGIGEVSHLYPSETVVTRT